MSRLVIIRLFESASYKLKAFLMFFHDVMAAVGTIMGFIKARIHKKRKAAAKR